MWVVVPSFPLSGGGAVSALSLWVVVPRFGWCFSPSLLLGDGAPFRHAFVRQLFSFPSFGVVVLCPPRNNKSKEHTRTISGTLKGGSQKEKRRIQRMYNAQENTQTSNSFRLQQGDKRENKRNIKDHMTRTETNNATNKMNKRDDTYNRRTPRKTNIHTHRRNEQGTYTHVRKEKKKQKEENHIT